MGRAPDSRADVFTIGVLAYQMVTGRLPYRAASLPELLGQMLLAPPVAPTAADLPAASSEAMVRALAGDPDARFDRVRDFAVALG